MTVALKQCLRILGLSTMLLVILLATTIRTVDAKGFGGGAISSHGAIGGDGIRTNVLGTRWWVLKTAGGITREVRYRKKGPVPVPENSALNSTATDNDYVYVTLSSFTYTNLICGLSGVLYVWSYVGLALTKIFIKTGRYDETEYVVMYFLSFLCLTAFTAIAYSIPINHHGGNGYSGDAWEDWFEPGTTFVLTGESPLNYLDVAFVIMGWALATGLIFKDVRNATESAPFPLNLMTKLSIALVTLVFVASACLGLISSWKVPMILLSSTGMALILLRYLGLLYSHQALFPMGAKRRKKCFRHDGWEWSMGFFSFLFHLLMAISYGEGSVLIVNAATAAAGCLALVFDTVFLCQLGVDKSFRRSNERAYSQAPTTDLQL